MKRRTRLIVELLKAVAVVVVVVQLTVLAAFCFYGADGIARWDSWRPLALHNIGSGTREDNDLFSHVITGHFRIPATDAN